MTKKPTKTPAKAKRAPTLHKEPKPATVQVQIGRPKPPYGSLLKQPKKGPSK